MSHNYEGIKALDVQAEQNKNRGNRQTIQQKLPKMHLSRVTIAYKLF